MPTYEYRSKDGEEFLVDKPFSEAPPVGHKLRRGRKVFVRQMPRLETQIAVPSYTFASQQLEDFDPRAPYHTKDGRACFNTKREVEEFCAKSQAEARPGTPDVRWFNEGTRHGIPKSKRKKR